MLRAIGMLSVPVSALVFGALGAACGRSAPPQIDAERIFPYLVTTAYPSPPGVQYADLGHGVRIALVVEERPAEPVGLLRSVTPAELNELGVDWTEGTRIAIANLESLAKAGTVSNTVFERGPSGRPFALFGGHWAAATCLLLPRLREMTSDALGTSELCASIPHRDALLVFPKGDRAHRDAMRAMIRENESDGAKPLTAELFELTPNGPKPLVE